MECSVCRTVPGLFLSPENIPEPGHGTGSSAICRHLGADTYLAGAGGHAYMETDLFSIGQP